MSDGLLSHVIPNSFWFSSTASVVYSDCAEKLREQPSPFVGGRHFVIGNF